MNDPRWQLAVKVSESNHFRKSALLAQFLLFICEHTLNETAEELTEQAIGEHVFRRRPGYSTGEDNIVRSYAHRLRSRLEQYFQQEGRNELVRISVPRGAYTAIFEENLPAGVNSQPSQLELVEAENSLRKPTRSLNIPAEQEHIDAVVEKAQASGISISRKVATLLAAVLLLAGTGAGLLVAHAFHKEISYSPAHDLWSQIFSGKTGAFIVTTDNGLGVLQDVSSRYANLHNYMDGSYFAQFDKEETPEQRTLHRLSRERLTSVADSAAAAAMVLLPEASGKSVRLRNARTLQLSDLKQSNLVLLGSSYGDPWVTLFEPSMNFQINYHASRDTYESEIINRNPLPGEQKVYVNNSTSAPYITYAIVALVPNLDHSGWVLLIEGLTMAGTEAAAEFVLHGNISPFIREATRNGSVRSFEIVLKTTNLDSESSPPSILLKRIY
ncbi:MAG TPA: hypothetical protein VHB45_02550 [Alloacidobacterium sp.]|nr:hypothetical protein [Alloacidobacterium sp.]